MKKKKKYLCICHFNVWSNPVESVFDIEANNEVEARMQSIKRIKELKRVDDLFEMNEIQQIELYEVNFVGNIDVNLFQ